LERRPEAEVAAYDRVFEIGKDNNLVEALVFDGASRMEVGKGLENLAKKKNIPYVTGLYHGLNTYTFNYIPEGLKVAEGDDPVWIGSAALSGILANYSAFVKPLNFGGSIYELSMEDHEIQQTQQAIFRTPLPK
jgi:hypothetical protein